MTDVIRKMAEAVVASEFPTAPAGTRFGAILGDDTREGYMKLVRAALTAALEHGWVLVPKEPTQDMLCAAWDACRQPTIEIALATTAEQCQKLKAHQRYRAMIASAPRWEP